MTVVVLCLVNAVKCIIGLTLIITFGVLDNIIDFVKLYYFFNLRTLLNNKNFTINIIYYL